MPSTENAAKSHPANCDGSSSHATFHQNASVPAPSTTAVMRVDWLLPIAPLRAACAPS